MLKQLKTIIIVVLEFVPFTIMFIINNLLSVVRRNAKLLRHVKLHQYKPSNQTNYNITIIKEAEKVVGYSVSFLNLKWIVNDEVTNIASHLRRLIGINHPLLETTKSLLLGNELPTWGLIVLLVSKLAGHNSKFPEVECDRTADILHSQRILAEVTEMIKTAMIIHKGLVNLKKTTTPKDVFNDLHFGNKLTLLSGDYLLSTSFSELARLRNHQVQDIISSTVRDLSISEFVGLKNKNNEQYPNKPLPKQINIEILNEYDLGTSEEAKTLIGNMKAEWMLKNILGGANLLGKSCQSALILANHNKSVQDLGYNFGKNLALAWQVLLEKNLFLNTDNSEFNLMSAPVMFHLFNEPDLYKEIEKSSTDLSLVNYELIRKNIMSGPALEKVNEFQTELAQNALSILYQFDKSNSQTALVNIIKSIC